MANSKINTIERLDPIAEFITGKIDWMPVSDLRGAKSKHSLQITNQHGRDAIYQIALESDIKAIGETIIHNMIGYTGKSTNIFGRLYALKLNKHSASPYIRSNFDMKDLMVRILFVNSTDSLDQVEGYIHRETEKQFGYRFAWREASGGVDGTVMRIQDLLDRIDTLESLKEIMNYAEDRANEIWRATWRNEE